MSVVIEAGVGGAGGSAADASLPPPPARASDRCGGRPLAAPAAAAADEDPPLRTPMGTGGGDNECPDDSVAVGFEPGSTGCRATRRRLGASLLASGRAPEVTGWASPGAAVLVSTARLAVAAAPPPAGALGAVGALLEMRSASAVALADVSPSGPPGLLDALDAPHARFASPAGLGASGAEANAGAGAVATAGASAGRVELPAPALAAYDVLATALTVNAPAAEGVSVAGLCEASASAAAAVALVVIAWAAAAGFSGPAALAAAAAAVSPRLATTAAGCGPAMRDDSFSSREGSPASVDRECHKRASAAISLRQSWAANKYSSCTMRRANHAALSGLSRSRSGRTRPGIPRSMSCHVVAAKDVPMSRKSRTSVMKASRSFSRAACADESSRERKCVLASASATNGMERSAGPPSPAAAAAEVACRSASAGSLRSPVAMLRKSASSFTSPRSEAATGTTAGLAAPPEPLDVAVERASDTSDGCRTSSNGSRATTRVHGEGSAVRTCGQTVATTNDANVNATRPSLASNGCTSASDVSAAGGAGRGTCWAAKVSNAAAGTGEVASAGRGDPAALRECVGSPLRRVCAGGVDAAPTAAGE